MFSNLFSKDNYLINARMIKSVIITEYDISKANISILYDKGIISDDVYSYLYRLPKLDREIYVSNKIKTEGRSVHEIIKSGIIEAKRKLFSSNNIQDNEIIRIANDAVYIMRNYALAYTRFGNVEFKRKHSYSTFLRVGGLVILFSNFMGEINVDIIGLGKEQMKLHENYMITFIGSLLYLVETSTIDQVMDFYLYFYNKYLQKKLDIGFYREFNEISMFTTKSPTDGNKYGVSHIDSIDEIDIGYNAGFLRELYGTIIGPYKD